MGLRPAALTLLAVSSVLLLSAPDADAGRGFVSTRPLHRVAGSGEFDARGGYAAWLRRRNDGTIVQGLRVWFEGVSDAAGATLWMAKPGESDLAEIGTFAVSGDEEVGGTSGIFELTIDSSLEDNPEVPTGVETMIRLRGALLEVRLPAGEEDAEDFPILESEVGKFRFRKLKVDAAGFRGRRASLRRPPPPLLALDARATGTVSAWRRRDPEDHDSFDQGIALFARGLEPDTTYDVTIEDPDGDPVEVGSFDSTEDGIGYFAIDSRQDEELPPGVGVDSVRELRRRRVEVLRSGFSEYSLAGLFR